MARDEANIDLTNYHHLQGKYSTNYEASVDAVFVSQTEELIAKKRNIDKSEKWRDVGIVVHGQAKHQGKR